MISWRWNKLGVCGVGFAVLCSASVIAERALANSSSFSWTMNLREVDGSRNGKLHRVESGELLLTGKVWVHEKARGANATPMVVTIEVLRDELGRDTSVCSVQATPSTILNDRREFSRSCGRVESGTYYLIVAKPHGKDDVDGWHNQGFGALTTK